jgi:prepilin-type processing-associated H-X9-DG protein
MNATVALEDTLVIGEEAAPHANATAALDEDTLVIGDEPAPLRGTVARWRVAAWLLVGLIGAFALLIAFTGIRNSFRESWRDGCRDQLKLLGLAMHEYNDKHGHFPAPAILARDGTPLLSWRVALLPHFGYHSLYERFHLDEPWDSPHNRALIAEMPREFGCPAGPNRRAGQTGYKVIVGPENDAYSVNTPFGPTRGADIRHFTDGTSNTILVLETTGSVPWTKPDDLYWSKGGPTPGVASPHSDGAHALFADGAIKFLRPTIQPQSLLAIITINGGEVVSGEG